MLSFVRSNMGDHIFFRPINLPGVRYDRLQLASENHVFTYLIPENQIIFMLIFRSMSTKLQVDCNTPHLYLHPLHRDRIPRSRTTKSPDEESNPGLTKRPWVYFSNYYSKNKPDRRVWCLWGEKRTKFSWIKEMFPRWSLIK